MDPLLILGSPLRTLGLVVVVGELAGRTTNGIGAIGQGTLGHHGNYTWRASDWTWQSSTWPSSWSWSSGGEAYGDGGRGWGARLPGDGVHARSDGRHVHGLHEGVGCRNESRLHGGEPPGAGAGLSEKADLAAWYGEGGAGLDDSLEKGTWPPGMHHRMNTGDTDDEPTPPLLDGSIEGQKPASTSRSSGGQSRKIPSTYPPSFSATPSESYVEWKRSVQCWIAGEGGQLPEDVMGPRCLSVLKGRASVIVRHLKIEEVSRPGGLALVFKALESSPLVTELDGQRGEKAQREFLRCKRQSGESMESFLMRVQAQRAVMEEEDCTFSVGDRFLVGYILDNAELTLKDRVMVLAAAQNQMTSTAIFPALRRMGPFLQGTLPIGKGVVDTPLLPELSQELSSTSKNAHTTEGGGREPRRPWQPYKAHVVEETGYSGAEEDEDFSALLDGAMVPEELEAATHAAMAAYSSSQAKLRALKQARGYVQKTEPAVQPDRRDRLKKLMQENPCRGCGQFGHWSKDPECPRNAKSSSASLVTTPALSSSSPDQPQPPAEHSAMSAVLAQMMKDQQKSARVYTACVAASMVGGGGHNPMEYITLVNATEDFMASRMVVDLGCLRTVAGVKWVVNEVARCKAQGRFVEIQRTMDYFRFGDGERRPSYYRVFLEVGLCNHIGLFAVNAVEYPCPPLLSKGVCVLLWGFISIADPVAST